MGDMHKEVTRVLDSYASAVLAKDANALTSLYDPDARVFDAWGIWSYEGLAAWRAAVEGWFASLNTEQVRVSFEEVEISGSLELALVSAMVTYAGASAEGKPLRAMTNRITWALRANGQALRIVHEHTSAPIGFEDMKAILQRERAV